MYTLEQGSSQICIYLPSIIHQYDITVRRKRTLLGWQIFTECSTNA